MPTPEEQRAAVEGRLGPKGIPTRNMTPTQAAAYLEEYLQIVTSGTEPDQLTMVRLDELYVGLASFAQAHPEDAVSAYFTGVGATPEDLAANPQDAANKVIADLQGLLSGGGATARTVTEKTERETNLSRTVSQMTRQYVEVETPAEFLDNFVNGLRTHVLNLTQSGQLTTPAAMWVLDNSDIFLDQYLGELGQKAAKGEEIFKVVGVEGEPKKLGLRAGAVQTTQDVTAGTQQAKSVQQAVENVLSGAVGGVVAGGATSTATTTTSEEKFKENQAISEMQQLDVYQMPRIAQVATLSPLAFLQASLTAKSLLMQYQGKRGVRAAEQLTALGPPSIHPRSVR